MTFDRSSGRGGCGRWAGAGAALLSLALLLAACRFFLGGGPGGPAFPHGPHIDPDGEGMECGDCHPGADQAPAAGFPASEKACLLCHGELDKEKPLERSVAAFLVDGTPRWKLRRDPYAGEVRFDHGKHAAAEVACERCHAAAGAEAGPELRIEGGKPRCLECHRERSVSGECSTCHKLLRREEPPRDHLGGSWKRIHGDQAGLPIRGMGGTACQQCHQEQSCTTCHQREAPSSHNEFWRRRGHGLGAALDRSRCAVCHRPDGCDRCHQETSPASHRGAFGPPRNRHCALCHIPSHGLGCAVCHRRLPSHAAGPATPRNTAHSMARSPGDCLGCHIALVHPNPGADCRVCHR